MKICILSTGRAGSTSLYGVLNKHLPSNYYCVLEPFNTNMNRTDSFNVDQKSIIESKDNVLIKTLIGHTQKDIHIEDMYAWLFEHFDEIILLDRLDKQLQVESFSYQTYKNDLRWHDKKRYRMELVPKEVIETNIKRLEYSTNKINELSKKYNKKIYYYEDIFLDNNIETINEFFNIIKKTPNQDLLNFWVISDEKRVRLNDDEIKLL
jgi:hypothetical protein